MNGVFFQYDNTTLTDMSGKFVSPYFRSDGILDPETNETNDGEQWVLSREPDQRSSRTTVGVYGTANEFDVLYNLNIEKWLPIPVKNMSIAGGITPIAANIVDVNVIGSLVDYVIQYVLTQTGTAQFSLLEKLVGLQLLVSDNHFKFDFFYRKVTNLN
jgi:hypothetical protein